MSPEEYIRRRRAAGKRSNEAEHLRRYYGMSTEEAASFREDDDAVSPSRVRREFDMLKRMAMRNAKSRALEDRVLHERILEMVSMKLGISKKQAIALLKESFVSREVTKHTHPEAFARMRDAELYGEFMKECMRQVELVGYDFGVREIAIKVVSKKMGISERELAAAISRQVHTMRYLDMHEDE